MDITYYAFAFYIFLLVLAAIWFYGRTVRRAAKKEDKGSYEKEQKLFSLYQNVEDMLAGFEEYAEESKKQIEDSLKRMKALSEGGEELEKGETAAGSKEKKPATAKKSSRQPEKEPNMEKSERIAQLAAEGLGKEQIAQQMGISLREVSLIMDVKKIEISDAKA